MGAHGGTGTAPILPRVDSTVRRTPVIRREVAVGAALAIPTALIAMWPVLRDPRSRVFGFPSDPLAEVWRIGLFRSGELDLIGDSVTRMANAPSGVQIRRALDVTQVGYDVPAWLLAKLFSPVLTYNLLAFLAIATTLLAMFVALRMLGIERLGASVGAIAFGIAPLHLVEAHLHLPLAFLGVLPFIVVVGVRFIERPSIRAATVLGLLVGVNVYISAYLLLSAAVLGVAVASVAVIRAVREPPLRRPVLAGAGAAISSLGFLLLPALVVLIFFRDSLAGIARGDSDVAMFSLRVSDYVDRSSGAYIGVAGLVLGVAGALVLGRRLPAVWVAAAALVLGVLVSLRPGVLGPLPMPSEMINAVVPYWRVFGRVGIIASLGLAVLIATAIDGMSGKGRMGLLAAVVVGVVTISDVVRRPPEPAADLGRSDPVADELRRLGGGTIAEYPLFGFDNFNLGVYLFRQLRHGRPLFNGSIAGTESARLAGQAADVTFPGAPAALARAGVRHIVVNPGVAKPSSPRLPVIRTLPDGTSIHEVRMGP
jgi:hypothetical protein